MDINFNKDNGKFVVADPGLGLGIVIVLTDLTYWNDNYDDLTAWCTTNGAEIKGMTVCLNNNIDLFNFILRFQ